MRVRTNKLDKSVRIKICSFHVKDTSFYSILPHLCLAYPLFPANANARLIMLCLLRRGTIRKHPIRPLHPINHL